MTFEWDDAKNRQNVHKHGYSFEDAAQVFAGVYLELEDTRYDYGERRYLVCGHVAPTSSGRLLHAVCRRYLPHHLYEKGN